MITIKNLFSVVSVNGIRNQSILQQDKTAQLLHLIVRASQQILLSPHNYYSHMLLRVVWSLLSVCTLQGQLYTQKIKIAKAFLNKETFPIWSSAPHCISHPLNHNIHFYKPNCQEHACTTLLHFQHGLNRRKLSCAMPASNLCIYIPIQIDYQSWLRVEDVFNGITLLHTAMPSGDELLKLPLSPSTCGHWKFSNKAAREPCSSKISFPFIF